MGAWRRCQAQDAGQERKTPDAEHRSPLAIDPRPRVLHGPELTGAVSGSSVGLQSLDRAMLVEPVKRHRANPLGAQPEQASQIRYPLAEIRPGEPLSTYSSRASAVRVCLVYDCLYPHTVGGAERWYRNLAERLAAAGHDVTYLTLRQWERGSEPDVPGVEVVAVGPKMPLYSTAGADSRLRSSSDWSPDSPPSPGPPLRRRPHCVVPVFLSPRRRHRSAAPPFPTRRRLDRGLDARLLDRVPRSCRRATRVVGTETRAPARSIARLPFRSCMHGDCARRVSEAR